MGLLLPRANLAERQGSPIANFQFGRAHDIHSQSETLPPLRPASDGGRSGGFGNVAGSSSEALVLSISRLHHRNPQSASRRGRPFLPQG